MLTEDFSRIALLRTLSVKSHLYWRIKSLLKNEVAYHRLSSYNQMKKSQLLMILNWNSLFLIISLTAKWGIILLMIPKKILLHVELLSKYDLKISNKSNKRLPRDEPSLFQLSYFF